MEFPVEQEEEQKELLQNQGQILKVYVRLALEKLKTNGKKLRCKKSGDLEIQTVRKWYENEVRKLSFSSAESISVSNRQELCPTSRSSGFSSSEPECEEDRIFRLLEWIKMHQAMQLSTEKGFTSIQASEENILLSLIEELPKLIKAMKEMALLKIPVQKMHAEYETTRAMAWFVYGERTAPKEVLSRAHDLVAFQSGIPVQSHHESWKDQRIIRNMKQPETVDHILALSIIELVDRVMKLYEKVELFSERETAICTLDRFIAVLARVSIRRSTSLTSLVREVMCNYCTEKLVFTMDLEGETSFIEAFWGTKENLLEWYTTHILHQRKGLTSFLFSLSNADYGQFEIGGFRYRFARGSSSRHGVHRERRIAELEKELVGTQKHFLRSVQNFDGVIVKRIPRYEHLLFFASFFVFIGSVVALSVFLAVKESQSTGERPSAFRIMEIISLVLFGFVGVSFTVWQCISKESHPFRFKLHGVKKVIDLEDLYDVSLKFRISKFIDRQRRKLSSFEEDEEPEIMTTLRKWLAIRGFGNNLPGIDVFYSGPERSPVNDSRGIRVDELADVCLCDGFYLVCHPDEKARRLLRVGNNLHIDCVVDGHVILISKESKCTLCIGGD